MVGSHCAFCAFSGCDDMFYFCFIVCGAICLFISCFDLIVFFCLQLSLDLDENVLVKSGLFLQFIIHTASAHRLDCHFEVQHLIQI